ncbi:hypothetical protein [Jiella mangrovi]|uniref:Lipoprotein n=1 Tax=Jiella mangrovi TaxID=2821407 RepID=A0ABS4BC70_9HYPH|nr:hypothetical protein [Jiella mangrovi]MBP0614349.1 hypothetical protein [Jiella mangrovi]
MARNKLASRIIQCGPIMAAGLGAVLSGCTGSDMSIAMGPNGPVPPENVGSISTLGAPPASASALGASVPLPPSPAGTISAAPLPPSSPIAESPLAPPSSQSASAGSSGRLQWSVGPQPVGHERPAPRLPQQTEVAALPQAEAEPATYEPAPPSAPRQEEASLQPAVAQPPLQPASSGAPEQPASVAGRTEVQFLPVVGAPQREAELLARALSEESASAGVAIRPASGPVAPLRLKGYFSAFEDGNETVLVYVWDVLDKNDQRIRRIQGQEKVAGTASDPWSKIDIETMRKVASTTMREAAGLGATVG